MEMIRHLAVCMDFEEVTVDGVADELEVATVIDVVAEDVLAVGASIHDVVPRTDVIIAKGSSHAATLPNRCHRVDHHLVTPVPGTGVTDFSYGDRDNSARG